MDLVIDPQGGVRCVYGEAIDLATLGLLEVKGASHVEPDEQGQWWADLTPIAGSKLGPFPRRSLALEAEHTWLIKHWLLAQP